jgi:iron complex transport system substrate-binding protein
MAFGLAACALPSPVPQDDGSPSVASDFTPHDGSLPQTDGGYLVDTTDMAGNSLRMSAYPASIVVLDPGDCEILYAIGAGDLVTGRTISCDYPEETNVIPYVTVDGKSDPDLVLLRQPQLVIMSVEDASDADMVNTLSSAGVAMLVTNAMDINNLYGAISLLGVVTGHEAEASSLVSSLITLIAEMQAKVSQHGNTVYLERTTQADGLTTAGSGTIFNSLVSLLGYHNEFEDQVGFIPVTQDQVIGRNPDIVITTVYIAPPEPAVSSAAPDPGATDTPVSVTDILARADWANVNAVKNKSVYYVDGDLLLRAGPRVMEGINALYQILYEHTQPDW